jgi:hypothetical protein
VNHLCHVVAPLLFGGRRQTPRTGRQDPALPGS